MVAPSFSAAVVRSVTSKVSVSVPESGLPVADPFLKPSL